MLRAAPGELLGRQVSGYTAYDERTGGPLVRRELATGEAVLILNLGPAIRVGCADGSDLRIPQGEAFVAGASLATSLVETAGSQAGIQIDLPVRTLAALIDVPLAELTDRAALLRDVCDHGRLSTGELIDLAARLIADRGAAAGEPGLQRVDEALLGRLADAALSPRAESVEVTFRVRDRLATSRPPSVSRLARELGWSRRRLTRTFRSQLGTTPSHFVRLARFERFWRSLRSAHGDPQPSPVPGGAAFGPSDATLADLALSAGYFDQAHLSREVRSFAGCTPSELRRSLLPAGGGFIA